MSLRKDRKHAERRKQFCLSAFSPFPQYFQNPSVFDIILEMNEAFFRPVYVFGRLHI